jgi:hypothetical protein
VIDMQGKKSGGQNRLLAKIRKEKKKKKEKKG